MNNKILSLSLKPTAVGPLLEELIATHRAKDEALSFPEIGALAAVLAKRSRELSFPLLWPIDDAAQRLAGAATVVDNGSLRVRGWTSDIRGERVLVLAIAETTPMSMVEGATRARALGAVEVHACARRVPGFESQDLDGIFDSRVALEPPQLAECTRKTA